MEEKEFINQLIHPETQNKAFQKLLSLYQKPLYNHIRSMVLNHDDADDVLQNTFIKVYRYLKDFKGESKLFSWMYRIATNESLTFLNKKAKANNVSIETIQAYSIANLKSDIYFNGDDIQLQLQKAIADLPKKQQLVFRMKYFQDLKYEEIAAILGTSVGALKASYHIAVKKIETFFESN
jgi:RNA polymerase sigma factor (sigma-70 family)